MLKWAGGKSWLAPYIAENMGLYARRKVVEPFCGSMAITLALAPENATLNDINPHLINFYNQVKGGLSRQLEMRYDKEMYYQYREKFNCFAVSGDFYGREQAELFYYLNRTCFNGLCRFNLKGEFNVPFGKFKSVNYATSYQGLQEQIYRYTFTCSNFDEVKVEQEDFLYIDPPYDGTFSSYFGTFDWALQEKVAEWAASFTCPVLVSNAATNRIIELYTDYGFKVVLTSAPRRISSTGDRTPALEMIATKNI